jgi:transcriptional regulator with XRE-family HTH domain
MKSSLGQRITYYRKKTKISQKALAKAVGVSPPMISRYEADEKKPNITVLINIAKVLNTTSDILLGLEPRSDSIAQTRDEHTLLRVFRNLNGLGQDRFLEYGTGLEELPKYASPK